MIINRPTGHKIEKMEWNLSPSWFVMADVKPEDVFGEDSMPQWFLVYQTGNWAGIEYRCAIREDGVWFGGESGDLVTHWMLLPHPPK